MVLCGSIILGIQNNRLREEVQDVKTEKEYLLMKQQAAVSELQTILDRMRIEDSLRQIRKTNHEEQIRLIRSATDADIRAIIESAARDTSRQHMLQ